MAPFVTSITNFASYITVLVDILGIVLLIVLITPLKNRGGGKKLANFFGNHAILLSFIVALASVGGSLFYSNIAGFQPCLLCWWARILLYPQAVLLLIALITKTEDVRKYSITLSALGVILTIYHTYLQFGGTSLINCDVNGVNCEHVYFVQYGYVTIPTMALTAFALILLFMLSPKSNRGK